MKLTEFLVKLTPYNKYENGEYQKLINELKDDDNGCYYWYLSAGEDFKSLTYFTEIKTKLYKTPTIDFVIYSDYSTNIKNKLKKIYDDEDFLIYKDRSTNIEITQIIPLYYYSENELNLINKNKKLIHPSVSDKAIHTPQFYLMTIEIDTAESQEYFPLLYANMENYTLKKIFEKENIKFSYISSVCDGCRKGGALTCLSQNYKEFAEIFNKPIYWITDHNIPKKSKKLTDLFKAGYGTAGIYEIVI